MKKCLLVFALLLSMIPVQGQNPYPKQEDAVLVLERKLAIQLLNDDDEQAKYQNEALKQIFTENWKNTQIEFLTKEEMENLINSKSEDYAFLTQRSELNKDVRRGYISPDGMITRVGIGSTGSTSFNYAAFTFSHYDFDLKLFKNGKAQDITKIGFANGELTKLDYLYLYQQLARLTENAAKGVSSTAYYNVDENIEGIKVSKLIILENFIKEKEREKIASVYENEFELVDYLKYQDIILNKEPGNYYVKIIWSTQHNLYVWVAVDSENGSIKSLTSFGGIKLGRNHDTNEIIKVKHIPYIVNNSAQKFNNKYK